MFTESSKAYQPFPFSSLILLGDWTGKNEILGAWDMQTQVTSSGIKVHKGKFQLYPRFREN